MASDADRESLETMEVQLLQLNEGLLLGDINETDFAFNVHDVLKGLPTPDRPAHFLVMKRVAPTTLTWKSGEER